MKTIKLIKMVSLTDVPYYSLIGWELHGIPMIEPTINDLSSDYRSVNTILQPMKKNLSIIRENNDEIKELLYNTYYQDNKHNSFDKLVKELSCLGEIAYISINPNETGTRMIEIIWK